MEVIIRPTEAAAARLVADLVVSCIRDKPGLVLGLATGRTMEGVYDVLASMHREGGLSFARVTTFNLDEYLGDIEKQLIEKALRETRFNKTEASKKLGISFRQLRYKLNKYGID